MCLNAGLLLPCPWGRGGLVCNATSRLPCALVMPKQKRALRVGLAARASSNDQQQNENKDKRPDKMGTLVIVPGWLSDSSQYHAMASYLRSKGFTTLIAPLKWYNWIPSLGGRSVRPILDRIDATIACAMNRNEEDESSSDYEQSQYGENAFQYTFSDFLKEFVNPKNGALPHLYPFKMGKEVTSSDKSPSKVILVAHSAGGWICRILLGGKVPYDGQTYAASQKVRALVTLGTPHVCTDKLTKRNMDFVNKNYPGAAEAEQGVDYFCIAGKFAKGEAQFGGLWKDFAWQSYELCCGKGDVWGDGVIPLDCAIGLEGAQHIILEGVEHFPSVREEEQRRWYGSPEIVDKWLPLLLSSALPDKGENIIATPK